MFKPLLYLALLLGFQTVAYSQEKDLSKLLWTADWSPDNHYLAIGGVDAKLRLYSGETFELVKVIELQTPILRTAWHPDSKLLAIAAAGEGSVLVNVETEAFISLQGACTTGTRAMDWNHNGTLLASADYEGEIMIWNTSGVLIRTIKKENTIGNVAIDWHPSKDEFVVLAECVRIYTADGKLLQKFEHRQEDVLLLCARWHPSGRFFAIGDYGDHDKPYVPLLQYWTAGGTLLQSMDISKKEYRNIAWTKRGDKLASASDALRIWSERGKLLAVGQSPDNLWGVDWSPNGRFIATASFDGHIKIWDKKAKLIRELAR
jgi:WD40 repeat protein